MINLLPLEEKNKVYELLLKKQLRVLGVLIAIIVWGGAIFVLNTLIFIKIQSRAMSQSLKVESVSPETETAQTLEDEIKGLNLELARYQNFRADSLQLGEVLVKFGQLVPAGVSLKDLTVDLVSKKVAVSGTASTRGEVAELEEQLKKSNFFERVESPLTNYLQKTNPSFSFSFYLK